MNRLSSEEFSMRYAAWIAKNKDAFELSEDTSSERLAAAARRESERLASAAQTLALLSLAEDVRRIADALESRQAADALAESVRIWG